MLGLPPLKMVLVHAENDQRNAALEAAPQPNAVIQPSEREAALKIIEYLKNNNK